MVLFAPCPTDGSVPGLMVVPSGTVRTTQVKPLSVETATPGRLTLLASEQFSLGTYAVPSGETRTWPCNPPQVPGATGTSTPLTCANAQIGMPGPKGKPPSSLREQNAVTMPCEQ